MSWLDKLVNENKEVKMIGGNTFWMDFKVFDVQRRFMEEQEKKMRDWWFNREYLKDD